MTDNSGQPQINTEQVTKIIKDKFSPGCVPRIEEYIQEKLVTHLGQMFYQEQNLIYFLDKYSSLDSNDKAVILKYFKQDDIIRPKIDNLIDAVTWHKYTRNPMPITVTNLPEVIANYNTNANVFRVQLLAAYGSATADREARIDVGVKYCMFESAAKHDIDIEIIASNLKRDSM